MIDLGFEFELCRVIPSRKMYPVAYRLYMELVKRYAFSLPSLINGPNYHKYECHSLLLSLCMKYLALCYMSLL